MGSEWEMISTLLPRMHSLTLRSVLFVFGRLPHAPHFAFFVNRYNAEGDEGVDRQVVTKAFLDRSNLLLSSYMTEVKRLKPGMQVISILGVRFRLCIPCSRVLSRTPRCWLWCFHTRRRVFTKTSLDCSNRLMLSYMRAELCK